MAPDPDVIYFDCPPSRRQDDGSFAPVLRSIGPGLDLWKTQNQSQQESAEIGKERPRWRLLWKYVFAVFQRLHKSAGAEITVSPVKHLQGKSPVAKTGGPNPVQRRQHWTANIPLCDFQ